MVENFKQAEDQTIVGEDSRSLQLTHYVLAERLMAVDARLIQQDMGNGDFQYLAELLDSGFRGYHKMSSGELWAEWKEQEDRFYRMYEDGELPWELNDEDPLVALEKDENGEVATYGQRLAESGAE